MSTLLKNRGELGFAGLLLALGIFIVVDTATIQIPLAASNVGPRTFPYAIGILMIASTTFVLVDILRGRSAAPEEGELTDPTQPFDARRVAMLLASVIAFGVLVDSAGYVVASSVTFIGIAITLGARHYVRVAVGAVALSLLIYLAFTGPLGIYLPSGVLDGIL